MSADPHLRNRARHLAQQCREIWRPFVEESAGVALLDIPNHNNPGDAAILLGELHILAGLGVRPSYIADQRSYRAAHLHRRVSRDGVVLLHGGGNTGDMYPKHQAFRETYLATSTYSTVQLPQSVHFTDRDRARRAGKVYREHGDLTFLARDRLAQTRLRDDMGIASNLCPDAAFALVGDVDDRVHARRQPAREVDYLLRTDGERSLRAADLATLGPTRDWDVGHFDRRRLLPRLLSRATPLLPAFAGAAASVTSRANLRLTTQLLHYAFGRVSQGRVLITDRLHGVILATVMGVPHVALDNSNGKVHAFHRDWLDDLPGSRRASSLPEAREAAASLLGRPLQSD